MVARSQGEASLQAVLNKIDGLPAQLRQGVADELWARLPATVDESQYMQLLADGGSLFVTAQYATYETIMSVVATVPAGATGLVQLASTYIPVGAGTTVIAPIRKILGTTDTRSLTISGASGPATLWLTGEQIPTFGVMGP